MRHCRLDMIRKTSLLHKIGPMARRSSFTKKGRFTTRSHCQEAMRPHRKQPGDYARFSRDHVLQHDPAIPSSDRSPLYNVRNHARALHPKPLMRNSYLFANMRHTQSLAPASQTIWWRQTGSNRRPHACKARALPAELCPRSRRRMPT